MAENEAVVFQLRQCRAFLGVAPWLVVAGIAALEAVALLPALSVAAGITPVEFTAPLAVLFGLIALAVPAVLLLEILFSLLRMQLSALLCSDCLTPT